MRDWAEERGGSGGFNRDPFKMELKDSNKWFYTVQKKRDGQATPLCEAIRLVGPAGPDGDNAPQIDPSQGEGKAMVGDAFVMVNLVSFFGMDKYRFIPPAKPEGAPAGIIETFVDSIKSYVKAAGGPDEWKMWTGDPVVEREANGQPRVDSNNNLIYRANANKYGCLSKPRKVIMVQGYLYTHASETQVDKNKQPRPRNNVVMALPPSLTMRTKQEQSMTLLEGLTTPLDPNQPISPENSVVGDLLSLNGGALLEIETDSFTSTNGPNNWYRIANNNEVERRVKVYERKVIPLTRELNDACWTPWEDVLNLDMTLEQVMAILMRTFSPAAVDKAFSSHPAYAQYVPAECLGAFENMLAGMYNNTRSQTQVRTPAAFVPQQPAVPAAPVQQPAVPAAPVQQPAVPAAPVQQPVQPRIPFTAAPVAPTAPSVSVQQPVQPPATPTVAPAAPAPPSVADAPPLPVPVPGMAAPSAADMLKRLNEAQSKNVASFATVDTTATTSAGDDAELPF